MLADGYVYEPNGLIYKDFELGTGEPPTDGQQVVFHYSAYNESGGIIDSSYRQARSGAASHHARCNSHAQPVTPAQGRPAETRLGINGMIPGFEAGVRSMRVGGRRRVIVPPELGPPVRLRGVGFLGAMLQRFTRCATAAGWARHLFQRQAVRGV